MTTMVIIYVVNISHTQAIDLNTKMHLTSNHVHKRTLTSSPDWNNEVVGEDTEVEKAVCIAENQPITLQAKRWL